MRSCLPLHRKGHEKEGYAAGHDVVAIRRNAFVRRLAVLAVRRAILLAICQQAHDARDFALNPNQ